MSTVLETRSLHAGYGKVEVLRGIDLTVGAGEIVAVLGANGAGKSTLLKALVGLATVHSGHVLHDAGSGLEPVTSTSPESMLRRGVALVPEGRLLFGSMTVEENLSVGAYSLKSRRGGVRSENPRERVYRLFPVLQERARQVASTLSGGEQQMLAIGRALMSVPDVLLLDEPSLGLAPRVITGIFEVFEQLRSEGITVVLVEQDAAKALGCADRGYVMQNGTVVLAGPARELLDDDGVREIYLGSWKGKGSV